MNVLVQLVLCLGSSKGLDMASQRKVERHALTIMCSIPLLLVCHGLVRNVISQLLL